MKFRLMENDTPPSPAPPLNQSPTPTPTNEARTWEMFCHLSALAGLVFPLGNIIGPLIIWQMKKSEFPSVDAHGKAALNFQLSALIYLVAVSLVTVGGFFFCIGWLLAPALVVAYAVIYFGSIILAVIAGLKANDGVPYAYPLTLKLVS